MTKLSRTDTVMIMAFVHTLMITLSKITGRIKGCDSDILSEDELDSVRENTTTGSAIIASALELTPSSLAESFKVAEKIMGMDDDQDDDEDSPNFSDIITPN